MLKILSCYHTWCNHLTARHFPLLKHWLHPWITGITIIDFQVGGRVLLLLTSTDTKTYYYSMFTALLTPRTKQWSVFLRS